MVQLKVLIHAATFLKLTCTFTMPGPNISIAHLSPYIKYSLRPTQPVSNTLLATCWVNCFSAIVLEETTHRYSEITRWKPLRVQEVNHNTSQLKMSWHYNDYNDYDDNNSDWSDDYCDHYAGAWDDIPTDDIYPLSYHPFRQIVDSAEGYLKTQAEYPLYDSAHIFFLSQALSIDSLSYAPEIKFHRFLALPAELRLNILEHYLTLERDSGSLQKRQHFDEFDNKCCVWNWPSELIMCDRSPGAYLAICKMTAWLPALALTSKKMHDEGAKYMLETTRWIDLMYQENKPVKIASRFAEFLSAFPDGQAAGVVKRINFPHEHRYNERRVGRVIDEQNPDVQLMLKCPKLETVAMTFHWGKLVSREVDMNGETKPRDLEDFLDFFHLRPMLEHEGLQKMHLDGIYPKYGKDDDKLECLEAFAKWIVEGFREKQGREVEVFLLKWWKRWEGSKAGKKFIF